MRPSSKPSIKPSRPARHFAGKPKGAVEDESSGDEEESSEAEKKLDTPSFHSAPSTSSLSKTIVTKPAAPSAATEKYIKAVSKQLQRQDVDNDDDEDGDEDDSDSQSDSESGSETDDSEAESSSSEEAPRKLMRPVFIRKAPNNTQTQSNQPNASTSTTTSASTHLNADRKAASDALIQEQLEKRAAARTAANRAWDDENEHNNNAQEEGDIDDTDDVDPRAERLAWAIRALKRQQRDTDERLAGEREREALEAWRALPAAEREAAAAERLRAQQALRDERGKAAFLQKYHHRGAFYQEDLQMAGLAGRDLMGARYEGAVDQAMLPKALQNRDVTKIGRKGNTRHRDLRTDDTGSFEQAFRKRPFENRGRDRDGPTGANASSLGERDIKRARVDSS